MLSTIDNCIKKIREIDAAQKNGEEIIREERPKELSVVWTSLETFQEWRMGYNILRGLSGQYKKDPRTAWIVIFFTTNLMDAAMIIDEIDKLEKLKAFW